MNESFCLGRRPGGRNSSRPSTPPPLRFGPFICLALSYCLTGCGFWIRSGITPPESPPPSGPPPSSGQRGSVTITPQYVALAPGQKFQFTATVSGGGNLEWLVNGTATGGTTSGTIDASGNYTAPANLTQSENVTVTAALSFSAAKLRHCGGGDCLARPCLLSRIYGQPAGCGLFDLSTRTRKGAVQFGKSTNYGLNTWQVATPSPNGGQVQIYVAGMRATVFTTCGPGRR